MCMQLYAYSYVIQTVEGSTLKQVIHIIQNSMN